MPLFGRGDVLSELLPRLPDGLQLLVRPLRGERPNGRGRLRRGAHDAGDATDAVFEPCDGGQPIALSRLRGCVPGLLDLAFLLDGDLGVSDFSQAPGLLALAKLHQLAHLPVHGRLLRLCPCVDGRHLVFIGAGDFGLSLQHLEVQGVDALLSLLCLEALTVGRGRRLLRLGRRVSGRLAILRGLGRLLLRVRDRDLSVDERLGRRVIVPRGGVQAIEAFREAAQETGRALLAGDLRKLEVAVSDALEARRHALHAGRRGKLPEGRPQPGEDVIDPGEVANEAHGHVVSQGAEDALPLSRRVRRVDECQAELHRDGSGPLHRRGKVRPKDLDQPGANRAERRHRAVGRLKGGLRLGREAFEPFELTERSERLL